MPAARFSARPPKWTGGQTRERDPDKRSSGAEARGIPGENVPRRVEGPLTFLGQQALS
jgi:hypothetical protein